MKLNPPLRCLRCSRRRTFRTTNGLRQHLAEHHSTNTDHLTTHEMLKSELDQYTSRTAMGLDLRPIQPAQSQPAAKHQQDG